MPHRLFVAIRPPEDIRDALIDTMEAVEGARWQSDEQLHLTLAFIGSVDRHLANAVTEGLGDVRAPAFDLTITGVGHFERKGRATALWARVDPNPSLDHLRRKVERRCAMAGAEPEHRRYIPHITLARLNSGSGAIAPFLNAQAKLSVGPFRVGHFTLFESHMGRGGSVYRAVHDYPLGSAG